MSEANNLAKIKVIANNVLYFNDSSDYKSALYQILNIVEPNLFDDDGYLKNKLKYIDEDLI